MKRKIEKYQRLIQTVNTSLEYTRKGENMDHKVMFKGFESAEEWKQSLVEQNGYLKERYDFELDTHTINVDEMNKMAIEAKHFLDRITDFLRNGVTYHDPSVQEHVMNHLKFLNQNGHPTSKEDYVKQTRFFMQDDFHRGMLEEATSRFILLFGCRCRTPVVFCHPIKGDSHQDYETAPPTIETFCRSTAKRRPFHFKTV